MYGMGEKRHAEADKTVETGSCLLSRRHAQWATIHEWACCSAASKASGPFIISPSLHRIFSWSAPFPLCLPPLLLRPGDRGRAVVPICD